MPTAVPVVLYLRIFLQSYKVMEQVILRKQNKSQHQYIQVKCNRISLVRSVKRSTITSRVGVFVA